ncbi:MAG TPA: hypothetical protein VII94_05355 [Candidatus Saccharimonadales bacterium]
MSSNNFFRSDLFGIYNVVQASMIVYPKEIIISTLRNFFANDSFYHFAKDQWGFPNTTDHTDLPPGADMPYGPGSNPELNPNPVLPTRLFIGENYRYNGIFYPAILIKSGGSKYVPISINRDEGMVKYDKRLVSDGYGHVTTIYTPVALETNGAWEGTVIIDVMTRSLRSRDDLAELIAMCFTEIQFETLHQIGIIVKPISIGAATESDDRNDKLFRQSLTLEIRTEWKREIPILTTIDAILFMATFSNLSQPDSPVAANLTINTEVNIADMLINM